MSANEGSARRRIAAGNTFICGHKPERSTVGIVLTALSLVVMPIVSRVQRRSGLRLESQSVVADSKRMLCTYMSAALLLGLLANALLGWWWADPIARLVIAALAFREGIEAWRGKSARLRSSSSSTVGRTTVMVSKAVARADRARRSGKAGRMRLGLSQPNSIEQAPEKSATPWSSSVARLTAGVDLLSGFRGRGQALPFRHDR